MNGRSVAQLSLGLLGLVVLVQSVWAFLSVMFTLRGVPFSIGAIAEIVPVFLLLGLSYALVFHSSRIATRFFPDVVASNDIAIPDLSRVVVRVLGLYFLGQAIPQVLQFAASAFGAGSLSGDVALAQRYGLLGALGQLAFALWLILRPQHALSLAEAVVEDKA